MTTTTPKIRRSPRRLGGSGRARPRGGVAEALIAGAVALTACGANAAAAPQARAKASFSATRCTTTVPGFVPGLGSLLARWLPPGFHITSGTTSSPSSGLTYSASGSDPPRLELQLSNYPEPLTAAAGGRSTAVAVEVQGRPGLVESGPPAPLFIGVYWKPTATNLLSVVGYKLPPATVIDVAQHAAFSAPGVVALPIRPGSIVNEASAVRTARLASHLPRSSAQAKLSSWSEISALLQTDHAPRSPWAFSIPSGWKPVWAVLLNGASPRGHSSRTPLRSPSAELVVVDAASGKTIGMGRVTSKAWFAPLTNRDPSLGGCPGGSTARLPFGVLTRDEEAYVAPSSGLPTPGAAKSVILKLTTVPILDRADPGLYGGCVRQSCTVDELVWAAITVLQALPGKTLTCLPGWSLYPPGYRPKQVREYVTIGVDANSQILCGPLPKWVNQLRDLAPPAHN